MSTSGVLPASKATRRHPGFAPLVPIGIAAFSLAGLTYYHMALAGQGDGGNPFANLIAAMYAFLGFVPSFVLWIMVLSWSSIWWASGSVDRPWRRAGYVALLTFCVAIQGNIPLKPEDLHRGELGYFFAEGLVGVLGYIVSAFMAPIATLAAFFLATDLCFFRYFEDRRQAAAGRGEKAGEENGVETEATDAFKELAKELDPLPPKPSEAAGATPEPVSRPLIELGDLDDEVPWESEVEPEAVAESAFERRMRSAEEASVAGSEPHGVEDDEDEGAENGDETEADGYEVEGEEVETYVDDEEEPAEEDDDEAELSAEEDGAWEEAEEEEEEEEEEEAEEEDDEEWEASAEEEEEWELEAEEGEEEDEEEESDDAEEEEWEEEAEEDDEPLHETGILPFASADDESAAEGELEEEEAEEEDVDEEEFDEEIEVEDESEAEPAWADEDVVAIELDGAEPEIEVEPVEADDEAEVFEEDAGVVDDEPVVVIPAMEPHVPSAAIDPDLLAEAQELVEETGRASVSFLERRLQISHDDAVQLRQALEGRGVIT